MKSIDPFRHRTVRSSTRSARWSTGPPMRTRPGGCMAPRPDQQDVPDDGPARRGGPRGFQDHRPRQVAPSGRNGDIGRAQPEPPGGPVQNRGEDARTVHPGQAHPFHIAAGCDERGHLAIGKKPILSDRGKRISAQCRWTRMWTTDQSFRHGYTPHQPARAKSRLTHVRRPAAPGPRCRRYALSTVCAATCASVTYRGLPGEPALTFHSVGDGEFRRRSFPCCALFTYN